MVGPEPTALPLGDAPICAYFSTNSQNKQIRQSINITRQKSKRTWYNQSIMSEKKVFTQKELETLNPETIIKKIQEENYSLLKSLGGEKLRKEMVPVGKICHATVNHFYKGIKKDDEKIGIEKAKKNIVKTLKRLSPAEYNKDDFPHNSKNGLVIGFNHPSLGEVLRILMMKVDIMGDKPMLFPVNLPWYESIAKDYQRLKKLGIIITPTITPSTWKKLNITEGHELFETASKLKKSLRNIYTDLSHETIKKGGIIAIAPSATRQRTVFKTKGIFDKKEDIIPTMSVLALKLYTDPDMNCSFMPIAVLPPKKFKKGLNLFKKYNLIACEEMSADYIRKTYFKTKNPTRLENFDYDFHKRIADKLPKEFWY